MHDNVFGYVAVMPSKRKHDSGFKPPATSFCFESSELLTLDRFRLEHRERKGIVIGRIGILRAFIRALADPVVWKYCREIETEKDLQNRLIAAVKAASVKASSEEARS